MSIARNGTAAKRSPAQSVPHDRAGHQLPTKLGKHLAAASGLPYSDDPHEDDHDLDAADAQARAQRVVLLDADAYQELVRLAQAGISARLMAYADGSRQAVHDDPHLTKRTMRLLHAANVECE